MRALYILLISLALTNGVSNAANSEVLEFGGSEIDDSVTLWSISYLMNVVFVAEYLAVLESQEKNPNHVSSQIEADKIENLKERARFAIEASQERQQELELEKSLFPDVSEQKKNEIIKSDQSKSVISSFEAAIQKNFWHKLSLSYDVKAPSCVLEPQEVIAISRLQKEAYDQKRSLSPAEIFSKIEGWSHYKIRCLVFSLMQASAGAKREMGFEPLGIMQALRSQGHAALEEKALRSLLAIRLLQLNDYSEALRILIELIDLDSAFRLPYEIVQRVYSLRQKGEGQVGLRGP